MIKSRISKTEKRKALLESDLQCGVKNIALFHSDLNPKYF